MQLALGPLVGALAAGNRAIIKPCELAPATAELLARIARRAFPPEHVAVVTGGTDVAEAFSTLPLDHLVFTGSTRVGKIVMRAAAENLVPVTLELGGKSPAIVARDASASRRALERIMAGKTASTPGRRASRPTTCSCPTGRATRSSKRARAAVAELYPTLATTPTTRAIINRRHYDALCGATSTTRERAARRSSSSTRRTRSSTPTTREFAPTLVLDATDDMP